MTGEPLHILQVLRAPVGGLFRHVADLTRGLVARGHHVGLVMDAGDAGPRWESVIADLDRIAPLGVTRIAMARGPAPSDIGAVRHVLARARKHSVDVIHGHGAKGGAYARIAGTLIPGALRPARFYTPHGGSLHFAPRSLQGRIYHALERALAARSETILFESAFARDGFASLLGIASDGWPVIHNGLDPSEFEPVATDPDATDVVYLGELRALKGVDVLIEALAERPHVTATLIGGGPDEQAFRDAAAPLGPRIRFERPMPARAAFGRGRIVVVPSRAESLPYVVLEAAAAGKPVIATRVGGIPEIFGPDTPDLIAPGDPAPLGRALDTVMADATEAARRAERLRQRVRTLFSLDGMVDQTLAAYRSKLNRNVR